jgi:hypothetical protein
LTFLAPHFAVVGVFFAAIVAAGALIRLEWTRPDRRQLTVRIVATLLALCGLALLAVRPAMLARPAARQDLGGTASLYTPGGNAAEDPVASNRYALPTVGFKPPRGTILLPDLAALRRDHPQVSTLHIFGDGLEPFDLPTLRGLRVVFHPPAASNDASPKITFLHCPRSVPLGAPFEVEGRLDGLPPGGTAVVELLDPDGSTAQTTSTSADAQGSAAWTIHAPAPAAAGQFEWQVRLVRAGRTLSTDKLGVSIVPPLLPRVLVLESTPRFDTAALRRWFEEAGGVLSARTSVGKNLFRFYGPEKSGSAAPREFGTIDGALLSGYDLLLADGRSLLALAEPERTAVRGAIAEHGLGLLTLADDAVEPGREGSATPATRSTTNSLLPWQLEPVAGSGDDPGAQDGHDRSVRLRWVTMTVPLDTTANAAPWQIVTRDAEQPLIRDDQGRILAASDPLGQGTLALTLVRDTGRWNRTGDPAAFAAYWSHLFSRVARSNPDAGWWSLTAGESGPVRVDEPLELVWHGSAAGTLPRFVVTDDLDAATTLAGLQATVESTRWSTTFWPRRAGWHRVSGPGGTHFDFYVATPDEWRSLDAARRRMATANFAAASARQVASTAGSVSSGVLTEVPAAWWFCLFLLGAGTLWIERRLGGDRSGGRTELNTPARSADS